MGLQRVGHNLVTEQQQGVQPSALWWLRGLGLEGGTRVREFALTSPISWSLFSLLYSRASETVSGIQCVLNITVEWMNQNHSLLSPTFLRSVILLLNMLFLTGNSPQFYVAAWKGLHLGENGYKYACVSLQSTWNYHNIDNCLYPNIKTSHIYTTKC